MLKETAISFLAKKRKKAIVKWSTRPVSNQKKTLKKLIAFGKNTVFGNNHNFSNIKHYKDFKKNVPIVDYEGIRKYISEIKEGRKKKQPIPAKKLSTKTKFEPKVMTKKKFEVKK